MKYIVIHNFYTESFHSDTNLLIPYIIRQNIGVVHLCKYLLRWCHPELCEGSLTEPCQQLCEMFHFVQHDMIRFGQNLYYYL